jgi:sugar phosphate isomerase/epimerase
MCAHPVPGLTRGDVAGLAKQSAQRLNDRNRRLAGLGPHGDAFAPTDDAIGGFDADQRRHRRLAKSFGSS